MNRQTESKRNNHTALTIPVWLRYHQGHLCFVFRVENGHGQVAACSKFCSTSGHRDPEIRAWSVSADAWRPALRQV